MLAAGLARAPDALAIRPDYDGERGLEFFLGAGVGGYFDSSTRFLTSPRSFMGAAPMPLLSPGFQLRGGVGWRFFPLLSAGLTGSLHVIGSQPVDTRGVAIPATAGSATAGAYVRFYPMPLIIGTLTRRRAIFQGFGDVRRIDPWISIGFNFYEAFSRTTERATSNDWVRWTFQSMGVPIDIGFDWRIVEPLAVSLAFGITTWFPLSDCGLNDRMWTVPPDSPPADRCPLQYQVHTLSADGNVRDDFYSTNSASGTNVSWHLSLGLRYTLTP